MRVDKNQHQQPVVVARKRTPYRHVLNFGRPRMREVCVASRPEDHADIVALTADHERARLAVTTDGRPRVQVA